MPMPIWGELCNIVQQSLQDIFKSSEEKAHGSRHAELNVLINKAVESISRSNANIESEEFDNIPSCLIPLARVIVADRLKNPDVIVESLQQEDARVNRRALATRWFFSGSNEWVQAHNFMIRVMPGVSVRTRCAIVKKLSRSLVGYEVKAQEFFDRLTDVYGYKLSVPLLSACSDDFIYAKVLEHKIVLSPEIVDRLYARRPEVAVKYLQLANTNNKQIEKDRKLVEVRICHYDALLPKLLKKHPDVFVQLYELMPDNNLQLTKAKASQLLKNLKDTLVDKPSVYLKLVPLEMVSKVLDKDRFEKMFENSFPKDKDDFDWSESLDLLEHYTHGDKYELLKSKFKIAYGSDLPTDKYLESSRGIKLAKILPAEERTTMAQKLMEKNKDDPDTHRFVMSYLPPNILLLMLKETVKNTCNQIDRENAFCTMMNSCYLYHSPKDMQDFLEYYYAAHKNEGSHVLCLIFEKICEFGCEFFDEGHWKVLMDIVRYTNARDDLFSSTASHPQWILKNALCHYLADEASNAEVIDEILGLLLVPKVEYCLPDWNMLKDDPKFEKIVLEKLLAMTPRRYPVSHAVWEDSRKEISVALDVVKAILDFNERNYPLSKKLKKNAALRQLNEKSRLKIESYPWLVTLIEKSLSDTAPESYRKRKLREIVEISFPAFFQAKIHVATANEIQDIESSKALKLLKREPQKILDNWEVYLDQAAAKLSCGSRAARRFVAATKWHGDISLKFAERSVARARDKGYVIALGILLDGEEMAKVLENTLELSDRVKIDPSEAGAKDKFAHVKEVLEAVKYANPPIPLEQLLRFRSADFVRYTESTLMSLSNRVGAERMANFARQWSESRSITVKKQGIRFYRRTATTDEVLKFLKELYLSEENPGVRFVVAKLILGIFAEVPNPRTWLLVQDSIKSLTADNLVNLASVFTDLRLIHRDYLSDYVNECLDTVEALSEKDLNKSLKSNIVSSIIENLEPVRASFLSQAVVTKILDKYFFDADAFDVSCVTQRFAIVSYLLPAEDDFEDRLHTIVDKFKTITQQYSKPGPKSTRYYPAKDAVQSFSKCLTIELQANYPVYKKLRTIDSFTDALEKSLEAHEAVPSNMRLNFYAEYLRSNSLRDFSDRCISRTRKYLEKFSELVIHDVGDCLNKIFSEEHKSLSYRLSLVEELVREGNRIGCLVAICLLDDFNVADCDEKYDQIVLSVRKVKDVSVQACLDKHLSKIAKTDVD